MTTNFHEDEYKEWKKMKIRTKMQQQLVKREGAH
jgi:hypothetical protein